MYILIVEDDPVQCDFIANSLRETNEFSEARIERISSESNFREKFEDIAEDNPTVIIMDIMLRWTDPSSNMKLPPKEIMEQGFHRAGIRCIDMLTEDTRTNNIPVIIYSVLDIEDLAGLRRLRNIKYLFKDFDAKKILKTIHLIKH